MSKKALSLLEQKIKKACLVAKKYTDDSVNASTLKKYVKAEANEGYLKTIILSAKETLDDATNDAGRIEINIPKDFLVKSGDVKTVDTADAPYEGAKAGDKYLDFVINSNDNDDTDKHIYIPVQDLVDIYKGGNGVNVGDDNTISIVVAEDGGLELTGLTDGEKKLAIKLDTANANGLVLTADGLKLALATATTAGAMSAEDKVKLDKALTSDDIELLTDAEIGSWFGYDETATGTILGDFSGDSITDEE